MTLSSETPTVYPNGISLGNDVVLYAGSGAPSATTLDGVAGPGSMYFDYTNEVTYLNKGTKATPSWEVSGGGGAGMLRVYNGTGGELAVGSLVYLSGVDATTMLPKIVLADANVAGAPAEWVLREAIADATAGIVYKTARLTGLNDNTGTVGDERYLSETAGAFTASAPTAATSQVQVVGVLEVKSATVGVVQINLSRMEKISRNDIQADAVNGTLIADDAVDSEHIAAGAVDLEHMSANSVDSDQYVDGSIDTIHIADDQVTNAKLGPQVKKSYKFTYAFGTQGGAQGALTLTAANGQLPDNFVITNATYEAVTALTTGGGTAALQLGITGNVDLFNDDNHDAGPYAGGDGTAARVEDELPVKLTAATDVLLTVGTADLTAGAFALWVEGYEGA